MNATNGLPAPGAPLINLADCFPDLEALKRDFDVIYFLDLCTGIEAAVLYDELYAVARTRGPGANELLDPLVKEGVIKLLAARSADPVATVMQMFERPRMMELEERLRRRTWLDAADGDLAIIAKTAASGLGMELAMEEDFDCTLVLSPRQIPVYLTLESVRLSDQAIDTIERQLATKYKDVKESLMGIRRRIAHHEVERIPLPPIALEAMDNARTFDELAENVLDLRKRYAPLRRKMADLRDLMADEDESVPNRVRALHAIKTDITRTIDYPKPESAPTIVEVMEEAGKIVEGLGSAAADPSKAGKAAGPLAKIFDNLMWRLRVRPLLVTTRKYMRASASAFAQAPWGVFRHNLTAADYDRADGYAKAVEKYVSSPRSGPPARKRRHNVKAVETHVGPPRSKAPARKRKRKRKHK